MASSGSFSTNAHNGNSGTRYLTFSWKEVSQNVSTNKTTISWQLFGEGTSTQWFALRDVKLVIAGETVYTYGGDYDNFIKLDQGTVVTSGTYTFTHNADGSKSFSVSMEAAIYVYDVNVSGSTTFTLDTIARASQPSLVTWPESTQNVGDFGETFSIHMNRKSDSFTHTVRYEYGSRTGTIATGVTTGTTWAVPLTFMNDIPESTSASGRIYVDTYNGSTLVGTKYSGFTVTVPANTKPSCSIVLEDITGIDDIYGSPVKGLSKIEVTVNTTQAYSSPIASYSISVNGETFKTSTGTTGVLTKSGSVPVNVTVKDKRGRTGTASYTMNVQDYTAPAVTMLTVKRCNSDGTENPEGSYCQLAFDATVSSMNSKNTATYTYGYKKSSVSTWTTGTLSSLSNKYSASNATYIFSADSNTSYDVKVTVTDRHNATTRTTSVSTAFTILNFHKSGTGMGIGKVGEKENTLQIGLNVEFLGNLAGNIFDAILPVGSIILRYDHTNPNTLYPGTTWTRIENRFLWATTSGGTIGQTGGASEVTLTEAQLPAHSHGSVYSQHASGTKSQAWYTTSGTSLAYGTVSTGGGEAHNNMPPYIQVSIWRRTG